jgi:uncharacterized membrane protein YesL
MLNIIKVLFTFCGLIIFSFSPSKKSVCATSVPLHHF